MRRALQRIGLGLCLCMAVCGCEPTATIEKSVAAVADGVNTPEQAAAPSAPADVNSIAELNGTLEQPRAAVVTEAKPEPASAAEWDAEKVEQLAREVAELRADVKRMQETMDLTVSYVVSDLQEENRRLREQLVQVLGDPTGLTDEMDGSAPALGADLIDPAIAELVERIDYGDAGYKVIKEWGRSPEEVQELGASVPSLRGLICVVSPGLNDAELSDLGRKLRAKCEGYENIVIDVFDDEAAARAYAERNAKSTARNVLTIQKDGNTGQDVILLHRNGVSIEVPR